MPDRRPTTAVAHDSLELRRLRRRIDALDRRIVELVNERARLGLAVGAAKRSAGQRGMLDASREREVLLRVATSNRGPLLQSDLLALYHRLILATRRLEIAERRRTVELAQRTGPAGTPRPTAPTGPTEAPPK